MAPTLAHALMRRAATAAWARLDRSPALLLCLAVLGWSGNFIVGRLVGGTAPPVALALWRWVVAASILAPFAWRHVRDDSAELRRHWRIVAGLSLTGIAMFNTLVYRGLRTTTAINGILLQSVIPLLLVVFAYVLWRVRPRPAQLVGLAISLLGVWVVVTLGNPFGAGGLHLGSGDALIFVAVVGYAVYTALLQHRPAVHPLSLLFVTFSLGALMLLPLYAVELASGERLPLTAGSLAAVAYVGVIPSIVSYFCWNRGVELAGAVRAGQFIHLMPVFGAALSWLVLHEGLHPYHLIAAALIGTGILVTARR